MVSDLDIGKSESGSYIHLVGLSLDNTGPLQWDRHPSRFQNWGKFPPSFLCSAEGRHVMKTPCGEDWLSRMKRIRETSPGYRIVTAEGDFLIAGWSYPDLAKLSKMEHLLKGPAIIACGTGESVASFDSVKSVAFSDGSMFSVKFRYGIPFGTPLRFEFFDAKGESQFTIDRKRNIWIGRNADRRHVLMLIVAERYLVELNSLQASSVAGGPA